MERRKTTIRLPKRCEGVRGGKGRQVSREGRRERDRSGGTRSLRGSQKERFSDGRAIGLTTERYLRRP